MRANTPIEPKAELSEHEWFGLSAAYDLLAEAAKEHAPDAFKQAAHVLDMEPANLCRGMAYLGYLLSSVPEDEQNYMQATLAAAAIAKVTGLAARLMDHQAEVNLDEVIAQIGDAA